MRSFLQIVNILIKDRFNSHQRYQINVYKYYYKLMFNQFLFIKQIVGYN
jgi:hypothetical protein